MTTSVPVIVWSNGSPVIPAESAILSGVLADINSAFGGGVNQSLTTPQGQIAQSQTAIIGDKNNEIAYISNQVNPDFADGIWQDAIGRIYFLTRNAASGTVVICTCTGLVGTVIPAGAAAQDANGYIYYSTAAATIGSSGSVSVQFQNATTGPIACPAGTLTTIYKSVDGWDTVTNPADGALGSDVESRADFEFRRQNSVAINATNLVQSIQGAVLNVANVIDAYAIDNPLGTSVNFGPTNYALAPNSICVSVAGGLAADIAAAIFSKKSGGCNYNGNTSSTVQVTTGYVAPYPTYTVTWLTPSSTPVFFKVQIANNTSLPANIATLIQNAVIASFNGSDGGSRARIASTIYAGRYYAGVAAVNSNVEILDITMGLSSGSVTSSSIAFGIDQLPTITATDISVVLV